MYFPSFLRQINVLQGRSKFDNWGGGGWRLKFIQYIPHKQLISKEIDNVEYEYMNIIVSVSTTQVHTGLIE